MQKELITKIENHNRKIKEAFSVMDNTRTRTEDGIEITSHSFYITRHDEWKLNIKELDKFLDEVIEQSIDNVEVDINHHFRNKNVKVSSYTFEFKEDNSIIRYNYLHSVRIIPRKESVL